MPTRAETYLAHLDRLSGQAEPAFVPIPSSHEGLKGLTVIVYSDLPAGLQTALTYGVSLADHPQWRAGRPELCLSVRSDDERWPFVAGEVAEGMRGECPFTYGDTIDYESPLTPGTAMTAFAVFAPAVLDGEDTRIELAPDDVVHLQGLYPIHDVERQFIAEAGLDAFWRHDFDPYDVSRAPAV
jgi:hypothetical protein